MPRTIKIRFRSRNNTNFFTSPYMLVLLTILMALIGALLLLLPPASNSPTSFLTAFFSAISAVTTTGLTVVETSEHWTSFGQSVMLVLAFFGGLGFMTGFAFLILLARQRIGLQGKLALSSDIGENRLGSVLSSIRNIVLASLVIQFVSWMLILIDFAFISGLWEGATAGEMVWHSLFQAVSSFNNAGLDIVPNFVSVNSISGFATNYLTLGVSAFAIILGGLGFPVIFDVLTKRRFGRFNLDSKVVLIGTGLLLLIGFVTYLAFEWSNPATLGDRPPAARVLGAFFESVTPRSAGFTTVNQSMAAPFTTIVIMFLMIVGGGAATTAGGIKVNAFMVVMITFWSTFKRYDSVTAFKRTISTAVISRAFMVIVFVGLLFVFAMLMLLWLQPLDQSRGITFGSILFEGLSAVATVGLSQGITSQLSVGAQIVIMVVMLLGRFGPITIALTHYRQRKNPPYSYPDERIRIG